MDTPVAGLNDLLQRQRVAWRGCTPDHAQRMNDLARLRAAFKVRLEDFAGAVDADFGRRPRAETLLADGMPVLHEIDHARKHLRRWMLPRRVPADATFLPARCEIVAKPLGVVGKYQRINNQPGLNLRQCAAGFDIPKMCGKD